MCCMLETGHPTIFFLLNRPKCTLLKDITEEIKLSWSKAHGCENQIGR